MRVFGGLVLFLTIDKQGRFVDNRFAVGPDSDLDIEPARGHGFGVVVVVTLGAGVAGIGVTLVDVTELARTTTVVSSR